MLNQKSISEENKVIEQRAGSNKKKHATQTFRNPIAHAAAINESRVSTGDENH